MARKMRMSSTELSERLDYHLSPITGYTRAHWAEIAERVVAGFLPYVDPDTAVVRLPGDQQEWALAQQLMNPGGLTEAFDRTIMAVAAWHAATGGAEFPAIRTT
jgi:hypothetical protein